MLLFAMAMMVAIAWMATSALAHDFGGPSGPGPPPPPDGCPGCCGGGGGGNPCQPGGPGCGSSGNPVNFWDGSERHTVVDVRLNGHMSIEFARTYDSRVDYDSPMGYAWAHSYDLRVFKYPDGSVMLRRTCGGRGLFIPSGGGFISPAGEFDNTLVDNGDGTVTLTTRSGAVNKFDLRGRLEYIQDVHGNKLEFLYDPAGRLPLRGTSKFSPVPGTPTVTALDYRLTRVRERNASNVLTGREINLTYDGTSGRLQTVSDSTGRSWSYTHDSEGNLTQVGAPQGIVHTYSYDDPADLHNLTTLSEPPLGFTLTYDAQDRVTRQLMVGGTQWDIAYTVPLLRTTVTRIVRDNLGATLRTGTTIYEFNSFGNPTKTTDALGNETTYTRDSTGSTTLQLVRQNVPGTGLVLVKTIALTYDASGNLITEVHTQHDTGEILTKTYSYDQTLVATQRVSSSLEPSLVSGFDRVYAHNGGGFPTTVLEDKRIISGGGTPTPVFYTLTHAYNPFGQLTQTTFPGGNVETNSYANGYLTGSNGETYTVDARGNLLTRTDRNGDTWTYTHDDLDRLTLARDPEGSETVFTYTGQLLTQIERGRTSGSPGRIDTMTYNAAGRLTRLERQTSGGPQTLLTVALDSEGKMLRHTDGAGRARIMTYDLLDRLVTLNPGAGASGTLAYDVFGNITRQVDEAGRVTSFTSWLMEQPGRPRTITNGLNRTYTAVLDPLGNLKTVTDPLGAALTEVHDALGRLVSFAPPTGPATTFTYNARGRLGSRTDASGQVTTYSYNSRGVLTGIDYPGADQVTLTLDPGDRIIQAADADSDLSFTYDGVGRILSETNNLTGRSTTFEYSSTGQRTRVITSDGVTIQYEYDETDNLLRVRRNSTIEVSYIRDGAGLISQATYGNGTVTTYTRDGAGRVLTQETRDAGNNLLSQVVNTLDPSGMVSVKHEIVRRPDGTSSDLFFHYTYDAARRLTREEIRASNDVTIMSARNFTYDFVGNRTTMTLDGGPTTSYSYGSNYRLTSETTGSSTINYTYDANGNLLTETFGPTTVTYGYDAEGRTISVDSPTNAADYALSWDGRRMAKVLNGSTTQYLYDGLNVIAEYPQSGPSVGYLAGLGLDEWILRVAGAQKSYFAQIDGLRSVMQLTSSTGAVENSYVYTSFGDLLESVVNTPNVRTFTGRTTDAETTQLYFRERLYSPRTGRFLSLDPFRPDAQRATRIGGPQRLALGAQGIQDSPLFDQRRDVNVTGMDVTGYVYVGNSPTNATDPTGEVLLWNPVSGSISSGCALSGCGLSGCGGSGCGGSGCFGSGCGGSVCGASGCAGSGCIASACGGSACAGSVCAGSACAGSLCAGSGCGGSGCIGSACAGSACAISICGGSACIGSLCALGSVCGGSVCLGSACVGSFCVASGCGVSICSYSTCGMSACTSSGCGNSVGCSSSGCSGSACNAASGCNSPCC